MNRGKDFENVVRKAFEEVEGVSIDRFNDNTAGFMGVRGISDFVVYKTPFEYYIECKVTESTSLPFSNITKNQWESLEKKHQIDGVCAGVLCWFINEDLTIFFPITTLNKVKELGRRSINCKICQENLFPYLVLKGEKKKVFYDYDMTYFFRMMEDSYVYYGIARAD